MLTLTNRWRVNFLTRCPSLRGLANKRSISNTKGQRTTSNIVLLRYIILIFCMHLLCKKTFLYQLRFHFCVNYDTKYQINGVHQLLCTICVQPVKCMICLHPFSLQVIRPICLLCWPLTKTWPGPNQSLCGWAVGCFGPLFPFPEKHTLIWFNIL